MRMHLRVKEEFERLNELELDDLEMDEDEKYSRKLESRLYSLQLIAVILGYLWTSKCANILLFFHDFTRVPHVFDLTCMCDAMKNLGVDSKKINPSVRMATCISSSEETKETPMVLEMKESAEKDYEMSGTCATNNFTLFQLSDLLINQVGAVRTESDTSIGEDIKETSFENDYEMEKSVEKDLKSNVNNVCFVDEASHLIYCGSDDNLCKPTMVVISFQMERVRQSSFGISEKCPLMPLGPNYRTSNLSEDVMKVFLREHLGHYAVHGEANEVGCIRMLERVKEYDEVFIFLSWYGEGFIQNYTLVTGMCLVKVPHNGHVEESDARRDVRGNICTRTASKKKGKPCFNEGKTRNNKYFGIPGFQRLQKEVFEILPAVLLTASKGRNDNYSRFLYKKKPSGPRIKLW
ncbi:hypothetical protein Tco_0526799 [Tanacetum coccineum]